MVTHPSLRFMRDAPRPHLMQLNRPLMHQCSQAQEMAAAQLEQGGDLKAAVAMWDQAIVGAPDQHQL